MLAVARIGAVHSVVFGGFSAESLRVAHRRRRGQARHHRRRRLAQGQGLPAQAHRRRRRSRLGRATVEHVLVVQRGENDVAWTEGRDLWWHDALGDASTPSTRRRRSTPSTRCSSSTPRAPPASRRASCTPRAATSRRRRSPTRTSSTCTPRRDVYWCTADVGWITGHTYVVYGPLANGATQVLYEGTPDTPHPGRWWEIIEKYGVTILYTAPTAIRSFMKLGPADPARVQPALAAPARLGRRADQPRGLDLVPPRHRRRLDPRSSTPGGRPRPARS